MKTPNYSITTKVGLWGHPHHPDCDFEVAFSGKGVWVTWLRDDDARPRFFFGRRELAQRQNKRDLRWMSAALELLDESRGMVPCDCEDPMADCRRTGPLPLKGQG